MGDLSTGAGTGSAPVAGEGDDGLMLQKHIRCREGDVARRVLLPGDPGRAHRIAQRLDAARLVAENREYVVYTGRYQGVDVSVCSTGIGGPSAAIALEELVRIGADTFIRVGSAGGRQKELAIGDVVVVTGAFRGEGTSQEYLPLGFPAIADLDVTNALIRAAKEVTGKVRTGLSFTRDAFYRQNPQLNELLTEAGVMVAEMECATLFIAASLRKVRCGAIVGTDSNIWLEEQPTQEEKERLFARAEARTIDIALRACCFLGASR